SDEFIPYRMFFIRVVNEAIVIRLLGDVLGNFAHDRNTSVGAYCTAGTRSVAAGGSCVLLRQNSMKLPENLRQKENGGPKPAVMPADNATQDSAFTVAIQESMLLSRMSSGSAPEPSTVSWKARISNLSPSS